MPFVRPAKRVAIAAVSLTALLVTAACGGGGGGDAGTGSGTDTGGTAAIDPNDRGPIEYWQGKDTSGNVKNIIAAWNKDHPEETVKLVELPDNADQQRQQMIQNTQIKNAKMAVLSVDVVWTAEFAANGYVVELPKDQFPTDKMLPATVASATYFDKLYAYPTSSDGGMLYYRKDLLDKYNLQPPTDWDEMKKSCDTIKQGEGGKLDCFAGQYNKYEGLTVNFAEAIDSAGGSIIGEDGKPALNSPEAKAGADKLAEFYKDGTIPKGAITWQEEQGRQAFQNGTLIFHRQWPYQYSLANKTDGSSKVAGKFAVAPLPGINGNPGVSSLGGHNFAIAANADNKQTAADFIKYWAEEDVMKSNTLKASQAPTLTSLYTDPEITKAYPYMDTLKKSIEGAEPRPIAVKYGDVTLAIQDTATQILNGSDSAGALATLQTKLEGFTQ